MPPYGGARGRARAASSKLQHHFLGRDLARPNSPTLGPREAPPSPHSPERAEPRIFWFPDFSRPCGEENFPCPPSAAELASAARAAVGGMRRVGPAASIAVTTLLSRGNRASRGFSGFVTFQGFAGRKIFLALRRLPNSPPATRAVTGRGGAALPRPWRQAGRVRSRDSGWSSSPLSFISRSIACRSPCIIVVCATTMASPTRAICNCTKYTGG